MSTWTLLLAAARASACTVPWILLATHQPPRWWLLYIPLSVPLGIAVSREILRGSTGPLYLVGNAGTSRLQVLVFSLAEYFASFVAGAVWTKFYAVPLLGAAALLVAAGVCVTLEITMAKNTWRLHVVDGTLCLEHGEQRTELGQGARIERKGSTFRFTGPDGALSLRSGTLGASRVDSLLRERGLEPVQGR